MLLEGVAERSMAYVVQKSGSYRDLCSFIIRLAEFPPDYPYKLASRLKNTDAVREPCVGSSRKDKFTKSKLLDTT